MRRNGTTLSPGRWILGAVGALLFSAACSEKTHSGDGEAVATGSPSVVTGAAATALFTYRGEAVHPACVDFSNEGSTRAVPIALATCGDSADPSSVDSLGWRSVEYAPPARGSSSYLVLAKKDDLFLLATQIWGGGTGQFSSLLWARLDSAHVTDVKDLAGGDRCGGGLSGFVVGEGALYYSQNATPQDFLSLASAKVDSSTAAGLGWAYTDCTAMLKYRFDLVTEAHDLIGATLNVSVPSAGAGLPDTVLRRGNPRACLDALMARYALEGEVELGRVEIWEFGRTFLAGCSGGGGSDRTFV